MSHALFPGTFDPPTLGHLDLLERALRMFERVTVALAEHPEKRALLSVDERVELWRKVLEGRPGASVTRLTGLVVHGCRELGATHIVRGVRSGADFDYEVQMARTNRALMPSLDTLLLVPAPEYAHISSTLVRQIACMGGDVSPFVPRAVHEHLARRLGRAGGG